MKCYCGNTEFKCTQTIVAELTIVFGETTELIRKDNDHLDGPFRCTHCGRKFDEYEDKDYSRAEKRRIKAGQL